MTVLRAARDDDHDAIRAVHTAAFPSDDEARLVDHLRRWQLLTLSRVAEQDGRVVAHVAASPVTVDGQPTEGVGLGPFAVHPTRQRQGVGTALALDTLDALRAQGAAFAVLLGDLDLYGRLGFVPAARFGWTSRFGGGDAFQVLALRPGGLDGLHGRVAYAPPFRGLPGPDGAPLDPLQATFDAYHGLSFPPEDHPADTPIRSELARLDALVAGCVVSVLRTGGLSDDAFAILQRSLAELARLTPRGETLAAYHQTLMAMAGMALARVRTGA